MLEGYTGFPQLIDIQIAPCEYSLVMPYLGKTLYKHEYTQGIFVQILRKVAILHKHNIVHFDIKTSNICIDDDNKISIIDFSHSILTRGYEIHARTCCGTYAYMPPEAFCKKNYKLTSAIDIWSIGCVLYELITQKMLFDFDEKTKRITYSDISNAIKKFDEIDGHENEKQIMSMIFQLNPQNRPTCVDILKFLGVSCKIPKLYTIPQINERKKVSRMRINTNDAIQKYIDNIIDNCLCDTT